MARMTAERITELRLEYATQTYVRVPGGPIIRQEISEILNELEALRTELAELQRQSDIWRNQYQAAEKTVVEIGRELAASKAREQAASDVVADVVAKKAAVVEKIKADLKKYLEAIEHRDETTDLTYIIGYRDGLRFEVVALGVKDA